VSPRCSGGSATRSGQGSRVRPLWEIQRRDVASPSKEPVRGPPDDPPDESTPWMNRAVPGSPTVVPYWAVDLVPWAVNLGHGEAQEIGSLISTLKKLGHSYRLYRVKDDAPGKAR
jgi:hypothetical protein